MKKENFKTHLGTLCIRIILLIITLIVALPIIWAIYSSFKTTEEYLTSPWALPQSLHWENYQNALIEANLLSYFGTSIFVSFLGLAILLIVIIPASYVLARFDFKFNKFIAAFVMAGLFVNMNYLVVPIFVQLKDGFLNNRVVLSLVYAGATLPFYVYLMSSFLKGIPKDYEEAATIDGCGHFRCMISVIVPMAKPGLVTVAMFGFMAYWNEYMLSLTLISDPAKRTLSVGLQNLMQIQQYATDWGALFAGLVMVMLPTMIFYTLVQKRLSEGISMGGIKG